MGAQKSRLFLNEEEFKLLSKALSEKQNRIIKYLKREDIPPLEREALEERLDFISDVKYKIVGFIINEIKDGKD